MVGGAWEMEMLNGGKRKISTKRRKGRLTTPKNKIPPFSVCTVEVIFSTIHLLDLTPPFSSWWKKRAKPCGLPTCRRGGRHLAVRSSFVGCLGQSCISQGICLSDKTWRPTLPVQSPRPCTNSSKSQQKSSGISDRQLSFGLIHRLCSDRGENVQFASVLVCISFNYFPPKKTSAVSAYHVVVFRTNRWIIKIVTFVEPSCHNVILQR
jgi:hypothetical protein